MLGPVRRTGARRRALSIADHHQDSSLAISSPPPQYLKRFKLLIAGTVCRESDKERLRVLSDGGYVAHWVCHDGPSVTLRPMMLCCKQVCGLLGVYRN